MTEPIFIKKGDKRVLLNGEPPKADCRVISEENYQRLKAGQVDAGVTRLEDRKRHWHDVSRGLLVGEIEEDEFEQEDATHMYGCYIDVCDDMRTLLKKNG